MRKIAARKQEVETTPSSFRGNVFAFVICMMITGEKPHVEIILLCNFNISFF